VKLRGRRIFLVEDEALIGLDVAGTISGAGGTVVGPFVGVGDALAALPHHPIDAAIVDLNLGGERSLPVLNALDQAGIPFVICSGYGTIVLPQALQTRPFVAKPFLERQLLEALHQILPTRPVPALDGVLHQALLATGADKGNIQVLEAGALRIAAHRGFARPFLDFFATVRDDESACGHALRTGRQVIVEDVQTSPVFRGKSALPVLLAAGVRSVCSTPILAGERLRGMLSIHRAMPWQPTTAELGLFDHMAAKAGAVLV